jgi:hypothetical protein
MELVVDEDSHPVALEFYKLETHELLRAVMLDFMNSIRHKKLFDHCIDKTPRSFKSDITQSNMCWNIRKRPMPVKCGMFWISPSSSETHLCLLSHLGSAGFDVVLKAISSASTKHITHLTVYQLMFVLIS